MLPVPYVPPFPRVPYVADVPIEERRLGAIRRIRGFIAAADVQAMAVSISTTLHIVMLYESPALIVKEVLC